MNNNLSQNTIDRIEESFYIDIITKDFGCDEVLRIDIDNSYCSLEQLKIVTSLMERISFNGFAELDRDKDHIIYIRIYFNDDYDEDDFYN